MRVSQTPSDPGTCGWYEILSAPTHFSEVTGSKTVDVAIVGSGFAGLAAAARLQSIDPSVRVTVVDAVQPGRGPQGRNSGFMIDLPHDLASGHYAREHEARERNEIDANRAAIEFTQTLADKFELPDSVVDACGRINGISGTAGQKHNARYTAYLDTLGESYQWLNSKEMQQLTGTSFYQGGVFLPGTVMLQPAAYINCLAHRLHQSGIHIHGDSPVLEIAKQGPHWHLTTPHAKVIAGQVILAVNGHVQSFGFFQKHLMHVFTYSAMTEPLTDPQLMQLKPFGITPADPMGSTIRLISSASGNRLLIRNRWTMKSSMQLSDSELQRARSSQIKGLKARYPDTKLDIAFQWAGRLCLSSNAVGAQGEVAPGLFSACCQNGLGTAKGTFAGMAAADLALGHTDTFPVRYYKTQDPIKKAPPRLLQDIGGNLVIRAREWRAQHEI